MEQPIKKNKFSYFARSRLRLRPLEIWERDYDLRSMESQKMHGSGTRIVNSTDGIQLEIERDAKGSGQVNCHVYIISDAMFGILNRQLESVQY